MIPRVRWAHSVTVFLANAALLGLAVGSAAAAPHPSHHSALLGQFSLQQAIAVRSDASVCPAGTPPAADECFSRAGAGVVPGLGMVQETYFFIVDTNSPSCVGGDLLLASVGKLTVTGKGAIDVALAAPPDCFLPAETVLQAKRTFTVTGGTGKYVGASGGGTLQHDTHQGGNGGSVGTDSWVGTLAVPGLDFDLAGPVLRGAISKSVRAPRGKKRARVFYKVTALDGVDGAVPVTCVPRSGSRFKIGRTTVRCSASDTSGNTATARFTIRVRARR